MEDPRLRAEFHRAFDAVVPPAPWLAVSLRERFRERRPDARTRPVIRTAWLAPTVAVLLAVAIVATFIYMARAHPQRTIPVLPPRQGQAPQGCPQWITGSYGMQSNSSATMTSASTGWFAGALRTTDGGAHWRDVSPPAMRVDVPSDAGARPYPPSYAEFFLDANRAWIARTYSSATSCFDHVAVFSTSDGGRTWDETDLTVAAIQSDTYMQLQLDFVDKQHGWLLVLAGGRLAPDWFVYSTTDAGRHWKVVSQLPLGPSTCGMTFISQTTGFLGGCRNSGGSSATLTVTRDAGKTWSLVRLPEPFGTQFSIQSPVFFDQNRGFVSVNATISEGNTQRSSGYLVATSDGGNTWQLMPDLPSGYAYAFGFLDPNHIWELTNEGKGGSSALYQSNDGGKSWTLVTRDQPLTYFNSPLLIFIDPQTGFIFQPGQQFGQAPSALLVTNDGGHTWKQTNPQIS